MFVLATGDTLQGVADAASKVTYTIFGKTLNTSTAAETFSALAQGQFSNSAGAIYTADAGVCAFIKSIMVVNPDTASHTFKLYRGGSAAANAITPTFTLPAGTMAHYVAEVGWQFYSPTGALIQNPYVITTGYVAGALASSGAIAATHDREVIVETNTTLTTTGQVYMQAIWLAAGMTVSNIRIWSGATAASVPTHYNAGLYNAAGSLLATGTDKTSTAWAGNTLCTFQMATPYVVPTPGLYYIAYSSVATTCPTIKGTTAVVDGAIKLASPPLGGLSATAYATGNMPATLALPNAKILTSMYAEVS